MYFVCEYSASQDAFHVDLLTDAISKNRQALYNGQDPGFTIIGIFETADHANAFADKWRDLLGGR